MAYGILTSVNRANSSPHHTHAVPLSSSRKCKALPPCKTPLPPYKTPPLHSHSISPPSKTKIFPSSGIPISTIPTIADTSTHLIMFLTDKHRVAPIFPSPSRSPFSDPFDDALSSRLLSLFPIPAYTSATDNLSWLSRACELLSLTISDATSLILHQPSSLNRSRFLDSTSLTLLDSCNSVSALCEVLLRRLLFVRFSLKSHKMVFPEKKPLPQLSAVRLLSFMEKAPHGKIDSVQGVICAVEAVSALVIGAIWVTLSGKGEEYLKGLKVNTEIFAWGKEFNKLLEAVSKRIGEGSIGDELEKMETMVGRSTAEDGEMEKKRYDEMERTCEEMRAKLEKLNASMNAVFQAALCARNAAVYNLMVGAQKKC